MDLAIRVILILAGSYLVGAIPFSLLVSKLFYKVDLRNEGSGNLGATNTYRVLGWKAGAATAILDIAKGSAAVGLAAILTPAGFDSLQQDWLLIAAALAAVAGHMYSPYVRFRGGKGVATAAGAVLFITPEVWVILLLVMIAIVVVTRYVSLASVTIALLYPVLCLVFYPGRTAVLVASFVLATTVIWRHRSNIGRLRRGEESKISFSEHLPPRKGS